MRTIPIYSYIFFGTSLRFLQDAAEGYDIHGSGHVLDNIDKFLGGLKEFNLPVTLRASTELETFRLELSKAPPNSTLSKAQEQKLNKIVSDIRLTLDAESQGHEAFVVTDKRLRVDKLLSDIGGLMNPGTYSLLSGISRYDFDEAGKCIAFNRATAAAFHLLRGTESVLRDYYCYKVKRERIKTLMWGPIVEELRKRKKQNVVLLNNLDNIRVAFRNPTQHPEKIYDIDEVQDLFNLCIDVINRMIKEIHSI